MTDPWLEWWLVFVGGLVASGHCVGMCGGLVTACALRFPDGGWRPHLLYTAGRVGVYVLLGAVIGLLGVGATLMAAGAGVRGLPHLLAGTAMLVVGVGVIRSPGGSSAAPPAYLGRAGAGILKNSGAWQPLLFGIFSGLLPCSVHWAFQIQAAVSGSVFRAMLTMALFGLGTAIPLVAFGLSTTLISQRLRRRLLQAAGLLVVILAVISLRRGVAAWF